MILGNRVELAKKFFSSIGYLLGKKILVPNWVGKITYFGLK